MAEKWVALSCWYKVMPQREGWRATSLVEKDDGGLHHLPEHVTLPTTSWAGVVLLF